MRSQWKVTCQGKLEPRNYGNWRRNKHEKPSERQAGGAGCSSGKWERALPSLFPMVDPSFEDLCMLGWCLLLAWFCLLQLWSVAWPKHCLPWPVWEVGNL